MGRGGGARVVAGPRPGHRRDTNRDTNGPRPRPRQKPGHKWIKRGHPPRHHRDTEGGQRNNTHVRRKPRPSDNARNFACTSCTTRTWSTTSRLGGYMNESLPQTPTLMTDCNRDLVIPGTTLVVVVGSRVLRLRCSISVPSSSSFRPPRATQFWQTSGRIWPHSGQAWPNRLHLTTFGPITGRESKSSDVGPQTSPNPGPGLVDIGPISAELGSTLAVPGAILADSGVTFWPNSGETRAIASRIWL